MGWRGRRAAVEQLRQGAQNRTAPVACTSVELRRQGAVISGTSASRKAFYTAELDDVQEAAMALKDLLVCIDPSRASDTRLKLALNLARAGSAYLTAANPLPDARATRSDPVGFGGVPGMSGIAE